MHRLKRTKCILEVSTWSGEVVDLLRTVEKKKTFFLFKKKTFFHLKEKVDQL